MRKNTQHILSFFKQKKIKKDLWLPIIFLLVLSSILAFFQLSVDKSPPTFSSLTANTTCAGAVVQFNCGVSDGTAVSKWSLATNNTGIWVNGTWETGTTACFATTLNSTVDVKVGVQVQANDTLGNIGVSTTTYFTTTSIDIMTCSVVGSLGAYKINIRSPHLGGSYPLVIFSCGSTGSDSDYKQFLDDLADDYIVMSFNVSSPTVTKLTDAVNTCLNYSRLTAFPLAGKYDFGKNVLVGHSWGANAVANAGVESTPLAVVCIAPYEDLEILTSSAILNAPALYIAGTSDVVCPSSMAKDIYNVTTAEKELIILDGETHTMGIWQTTGNIFTSKVETYVSEWIAYHLYNSHDAWQILKEDIKDDNKVDSFITNIPPL
jgi:hypothetical protein